MSESPVLPRHSRRGCGTGRRSACAGGGKGCKAQARAAVTVSACGRWEAFALLRRLEIPPETWSLDAQHAWPVPARPGPTRASHHATGPWVHGQPITYPAYRSSTELVAVKCKGGSPSSLFQSLRVVRLQVARCKLATGVHNDPGPRHLGCRPAHGARALPILMPIYCPS